MKQLAPQTVGVAPSLGAAGWMAVGRHVAIIRTVAAGRVLVAIADLENLKNRVGKRFATGTPGSGNDRTIGSLLAHRRGSHRTGRRGSSTTTLAAVSGYTERKSSAGTDRVMATLTIKNVPRAKNVPRPRRRPWSATMSRRRQRRNPPNRPPPNRSPKLPLEKRLPHDPPPPPQRSASPPNRSPQLLPELPPPKRWPHESDQLPERSHPPLPKLDVRFCACVRACCSWFAQLVLPEDDCQLFPLAERCC